MTIHFDNAPNLLSNTELFDLHRSLRNPIRPGRITGLSLRKHAAPLNPEILLACERCVAVVVAKTGISRDRLLGWRKTEAVAMARHMAIFLARRTTSGSGPELGRFFQRSHAVIFRSTQLIQTRMDEYPAFAATMKELLRSVREDGSAGKETSFTSEISGSR